MQREPLSPALLTSLEVQGSKGPEGRTHRVGEDRLLNVYSKGVSLSWFILLQPADIQQNMWAFWKLEGCSGWWGHSRPVFLRKDVTWLRPQAWCSGDGPAVGVFRGHGNAQGCVVIGGPGVSGPPAMPFLLSILLHWSFCLLAHSILFWLL